MRGKSSGVLFEAERHPQAPGDVTPISMGDRWARAAADMSEKPGKGPGTDLLAAALRDRGMQSFIARVRDRHLFLAEKREGKLESDAGVSLCTRKFERICTTRDSLIESTQPCARRHNKRRLRVGSCRPGRELASPRNGPALKIDFRTGMLHRPSH